MGYSIGIGEKEVIIEDGFEFVYAKDQTLESAPEFEGDGLTGQSNQRHPSYSGFAYFVEEAGLEELFKELMAKHPGVVALKQEHVDKIREAKEYRMKKNPNAEPGFGEDMDDILARLIWFKFWMDWAINNCKEPVLANS